MKNNKKSFSRYLDFWPFGHVEKGLHLKDNVNFKIYDVTTWLASNIHIDQYLKQAMKFVQLIEYNKRNIFLEKIVHKMWWRNYSQTIF